MTPRSVPRFIALVTISTALAHCGPGAAHSDVGTGASAGATGPSAANDSGSGAAADGGHPSGGGTGLAETGLGSSSGSTASGARAGMPSGAATSGPNSGSSLGPDSGSSLAPHSGSSVSSGSSSGATTTGTDSGGTSGSGSASPASGGATDGGACAWGAAQNHTGSFTWYYFGQGTYRQNGAFKTACGYAGTESGTGQTAVDTVSNIASTAPAKSTYFAAIPGTSSNHFDTVTACGSCVEITGMNGSKIVATVIDECPTDTNPKCGAGHLDLSTQAFDALGYGMNGAPTGTTWRFVACPVTGNIVAVANAPGQFYLQNAAYPITAVNGQGPTNYGYFNVAPGSITITSAAAGQTIRAAIPGQGGGDTGAQFAKPSNCH